MKRKRLLALVLAFCLVLAVSAQALAADGDEADVPQGTTPGQGQFASSGGSTMTGDGTDFKTNGDDDALAANDPDPATDIYVWAKVLDRATPTYKIDIAWGAMKFEFKSSTGTWDTTNHVYTTVNPSEWTIAGYLDATNNKVTVTNHSNHAVDATFAYAMDGSPFNAVAGADSVVGNFFADNPKALAAALVLTNVTGVTDKLPGDKIELVPADAYRKTGAAADVPVFTNANKRDAGAEREKDVFFAFSGTPDLDLGDNLADFTKVGVITVTIATSADDADYGEPQTP